MTERIEKSSKERVLLVSFFDFLCIKRSLFELMTRETLASSGKRMEVELVDTELVFLLNFSLILFLLDLVS